MIYFVRLCLIVSAKCNRNCSYCIEHGAQWKDTDISPDVLEYLTALKPGDATRVVCLSGGEPLLHPRRVMSLASVLPEHLHVKIATNGDLLTPDMVDFINERGMELHLSHDGPNTSLTRGRDILRDSRLLGLLRRVRKLSIAYVVNDSTLTQEKYVPWFDSVLERDDWCPLLMIEASDNNVLLSRCVERKIFFTHHQRYNYFHWYQYNRETRKYPVTLTLHLNGDLYSMCQKYNYGSLWQSQSDLDYKLEYQHNMEFEYCKNNQFCLVRSRCKRALRSGKRYCDYQALTSDPETVFIPL